MIIDLHIHSRDCSDGAMSISGIFARARLRGIDVISITDHDSIDCQEEAEKRARESGIRYIRGLELNVSFSHPGYKQGKPISLDFLAYDFDPRYRALKDKLIELREHRRRRADKILKNLNRELEREGSPGLTSDDMEAIEAGVDGAYGRPHIAEYLVSKGLVVDRQEAFDKYLVRCNEPKMPLSLAEASALAHGAGGKLVLAHPNDPNGTSLVSYTRRVEEQQGIIRGSMLAYIDGVECWHSRHDPATTRSYLSFAESEGLMATGGSDCHQRPVIMGTLDIPAFVAAQFGITPEGNEDGR